MDTPSSIRLRYSHSSTPYPNPKFLSVPVKYTVTRTKNDTVLEGLQTLDPQEVRPFRAGGSVVGHVFPETSTPFYHLADERSVDGDEWRL